MNTTAMNLSTKRTGYLVNRALWRLYCIDRTIKQDKKGGKTEMIIKITDMTTIPENCLQCTEPYCMLSCKRRQIELVVKKEY